MYVCYEKKVYICIYVCIYGYIHTCQSCYSSIPSNSTTKKYAFEEQVALFVLKLIVWKG